jgi:hypothetical protein
MEKLLTCFCIISLLISGCKKDNKNEPQPEPLSVIIKIENEVDGQPLQPGVSYVNEAGNSYTVDELKYYLSNLTFRKSDGTEFKATNYELVNDADAQSKRFVIAGIPAGVYDSLAFIVGVDSTKNFNGANSGDLDPVNGMYWDWSSGYIFFKHEGTFTDSSGNVNPLTFHYATLKALVYDTIPLSMTLDQTTLTITLGFNLNKVYGNPNIMDFNGENIHQSTGPSENGWIQLLRQNFHGAFTVKSVL